MRVMWLVSLPGAALLKLPLKLHLPSATLDSGLAFLEMSRLAKDV